MNEQKRCYGGMFPDWSAPQNAEKLSGKVISARVTSFGIGVQERSSQVDWDAWDKCQQCEVYRSCYDLSLARTLLGANTGHR